MSKWMGMSGLLFVVLSLCGAEAEARPHASTAARTKRPSASVAKRSSRSTRKSAKPSAPAAPTETSSAPEETTPPQPATNGANENGISFTAKATNDPGAQATADSPHASKDEPTASEASEDETRKRFAFDVHPAVLLPIGDLSAAAGLGLGAAVQFEYRATPKLSVTGRGGFVYHLPVETLGLKVGLHEIPLLGGVRYYFTGDSRGVFGFAELGLVHLTARVESDASKYAGLFGSTTTGGSSSASASTIKFGGAIGAGYRAGPVDARANFVVLDVGSIGSSTALMASVGFAFAEF